MRITHTEISKNDRNWTAITRHTYDDGTSQDSCHIFPLDTMEWRAAEYSIDPSDVDTLLDIVLAEPYLTSEDWATGYQLHDAPDIATARTDHIARCARVKLRHRISTRGAGREHLAQVRNESWMNDEVLAVKREHVAQLRQQHAAQRAAIATDLHGARAAQLREALGRSAGTSDQAGA